MGLSETILAAMIGAMATVSTALFQIFNAFRQRGKVDAKPKRGSAFKSVLAVLALMIASAAGGFLYSEFLKQRQGEDIRAMRQELRELRELTALAAQKRDDHIRNAGTPANTGGEPAQIDASSAIPASLESGQSSVESVVYVPACLRPLTASGGAAGEPGNRCLEADAQRIALCGTVSAYARVYGIDLFVQPNAVQNPWEQHRVTFEQDVGGARFTGKSFEYAQGEDRKAVCVNFMHWSSDHPHIARILVQYGFGERPVTPPSAQTATLPAPGGAPVNPGETIQASAPTAIAADAFSPIAPAAAFPGNR